MAQRHYLAALDTTRALAEGAAGPLQVFPQVLQGLLLLQEPVLNCRAWLAVPSNGAAPEALARKSFLVCAPSREEAEGYVRTLLRAFQPGPPPLHPPAIAWQLAPKERQPDGPVRPGIQAVF